MTSLNCLPSSPAPSFHIESQRAWQRCCHWFVRIQNGIQGKTRMFTIVLCDLRFYTIAAINSIESNWSAQIFRLFWRELDSWSLSWNRYNMDTFLKPKAIESLPWNGIFGKFFDRFDNSVNCGILAMALVNPNIKLNFRNRALKSTKFYK